MTKTINLTSNNGLGWRFGDDGARVVELTTEHGFAWTATDGAPVPASVVTNNAEDVTNLGEFVTNGS